MANITLDLTPVNNEFIQRVTLENAVSNCDYWIKLNVNAAHTANENIRKKIGDDPTDIEGRPVDDAAHHDDYIVEQLDKQDIAEERVKEWKQAKKTYLDQLKKYFPESNLVAKQSKARPDYAKRLAAALAK